MLVACSASPQPTTIANQPTSTRAIEPPPAAPDVTSCRALVTKEYDDGHDEFFDPKTGNRVIVTTTDVCGLIMQPVYFKKDSPQVEPMSADPMASILACLHQTEGQKFRMELTGHATPDEVNPEALALARAQALEQYFTACGVPVLGLSTKSAGAREPIERNDPESSRAASRRVEFLILERFPSDD